MKSAIRWGSCLVLVAGGVVVGAQSSRAAQVLESQVDPTALCGSDSDCKGHGKCSSGSCNHCGSDSDCATGHCSSGMCGSCGSDSDCKGNGKCSSSRCGNCGSDSDCLTHSCSSGRCKDYYP